MLITMFTHAQTITIFTASPTFCPGDSLNVAFRWDQTPGTVNFNLEMVNLNQIWNINTNTFSGLQKQIVAGDTIYMIKLPTKPFFPVGGALLSPDWITTTPIEIVYCDAVGINELTYKLSFEPVYYDLMGNKITKRFNEPIIEQIGTTRKKIIIIQ
jgi:hypothetical protein